MCGTAPSWQELFSRLQHWSVRSCVRPLDAVHTTAGHNALRGSGPGQKDAFDDAMAQVGCPDRRIDRLCITCCSRSSPCLASLVGDHGTLMQCEFYNDNVFHHGSGGCSASHGALFRLEF